MHWNGIKKGSMKSCLRGEKGEQGGEEKEHKEWGGCQLGARVAVVR